MADQIEIGDFIQAGKSLGFAVWVPQGWVRGEGSIGRVPAWRVDIGGGKETVMLKAYAVLLHKGETDG